MLTADAESITMHLTFPCVLPLLPSPHPHNKKNQIRYMVFFTYFFAEKPGLPALQAARHAGLGRGNEGRAGPEFETDVPAVGSHAMQLARWSCGVWWRK
eukprot:scaffold733_cov267-Pinguiococcus_pyrenoidosus.AAC.16